MQVVETEVTAEREQSAAGLVNPREQQALPEGEDGDIAITAIEALGNLLQVRLHIQYLWQRLHIVLLTCSYHDASSAKVSPLR